MGYLDYAGLQYLWGKLKEKFAPKSHSHDDRYYTEAEMDGKLNSKVNNNEAGANGLINKLSTADGIPNDATVFISQHNDGKTASYCRRPISTLWTYIKGKADGVYQSKGSYAASNHSHTKDQVGLGNVDNTADRVKSVAIANFAKETYINQYKTVNLTDLDQNTWYPVTGTVVQSRGLRHFKCSVQLNSGSKPSWSTHGSGFTAVVDILEEQSGWGTTGMLGEVLINEQRFIADESKPPVGYQQLSYGSVPVWWLRGGGTYFLATDYDCTWTIQKSKYENSGQSVTPTTTYPGVNVNRATIIANLNGNANTAEVATVGVRDYNNANNIIKIGWSGADLDANTLSYVAGYTSDMKIHTASKDGVRSWLGLGASAYKKVQSLSAVGHSDWQNQSTDDGFVPTMAFMAFWNGAFNGNGASNLQYCDRGRFGTIVTKSSGDYAAVGHIHSFDSITGKPSTYTPSEHTHDDRYYTESEMNAKLDGKSNIGHTHDDRYYTETEINTKLNGKAPNEHTHQYLSLYGARPANINFTKSTNGTGAMFHFVATSSTTTGKPPDDSSILQLNWDNNGGWDSQLALSTTAKPHVYYRNQQNGTWGNWSTLLDNLNYIDYAAKKEHTHTKAQITDFPASLKNPTALTIQTNGAIAATYDGSAAKTVNITKGNIGLGNVDNTADANKSVKYATSAGNANTATKATIAGTADNATTSNGVKDYNDANKTIKIGFAGAGLTAENLNYIAGYTDNGTKIKDVSKDVLKSWIGLGNYLPLIGGTMSGQITKSTGGSWIGDRDRAAIKSSYAGDSSYGAVAAMATKNGYWTMGNLGGNESLIFNYSTDAKYNAGKNETSQVYLPAQAGTIITSATIGSQSVNYANSAGSATSAGSVAWGNVSGKPSTFTPASHTHDDRYYTKTEVNTKLDGKSNTGHTHDDRYYTESEVNTKLANYQPKGNYAAASHTHNYAGSGTAGGSANSAIKLDSSAGSTTQPVYFKDGKPVATTYALNKTVPADAKFTDTNTWRGIQNNLTSDSTDQSLSAAQGKALKTLVDGKAPASHKHTKSQITDFPTSMPASDVSAWAKAATKPSYTKAEVGLSNVDNTADKDKSVKYAASAGSASQLNGFTIQASTSDLTAGSSKLNNNVIYIVYE